MSSIGVSRPSPDERRQSLLRAVTTRAHQNSASENVKTLAQIHETKQNFRRLLDPGIVRPNNKESAELAIKTLETLSANLLREPQNPKFRSFKLTNNAIKKRLAEVNGAIEYAVALGFHYKIQEFQPTYVFNDKHIEDLRIGNEILKEHMEREVVKQQHVSANMSEKEVQEAIRRNVHMQFLEDRMDKQHRDQRDAQRRAEREAAVALEKESQVEANDSDSDDAIPGGSGPKMKGVGHRLGDSVDVGELVTVSEEDIIASN